MSPFGDPCGLSGSNYTERYGGAELFLALMGTGTTRSLYVLTAREADSRRLMFDLRVEVGLDDLMARGRRSNRPADDELRDIALSYARYLVDTGAFRRVPHFRLQVGVEAEVLTPVER